MLGLQDGGAEVQNVSKAGARAESRLPGRKSCRLLREPESLRARQLLWWPCLLIVCWCLTMWMTLNESLEAVA